MPLVDMQTNLKSLRYGKDTVGGGNSNQPYVTTPIPKDLSDVGRTGGPDFLLRGGTLVPNIVIRDVSRLTKMLFDFRSPNGPLFIAKQNVLSLTNVNSSAGVEEFSAATADKSGNFFQRLGSQISTFFQNNVAVNQGIYTPIETIVQAATGFAGNHVIKQGFNPIDNVNPDLQQSYGFSTNRNLPLAMPTYLRTMFPQGPGGRFDNDGVKSRLTNLATRKIFAVNAFNEFELYRYAGGPGATLGVGQTILNITKENKTAQQDSNLNFWGSGINQSVGRTALTYNQLISVPSFVNIDVSSVGDAINPGPQLRIPTGKGGTALQNPNYQFILAPSGSQEIPATLGFRNRDNEPGNEFHIEQRVNLGDPGKRGNLSSYTIGKRDLNTPISGSVFNNSKNALDKLNALPVYKSSFVVADSIKNDFVKFRIAAVDNDNPSLSEYIHFRAFINNFSDDYQAQWEAQKYMGRGEDFYKYGGFGRTISVDWTIAAQSKQELIPMHQKMNFLASLCAPDYSKIGYMRGNLCRLTIGGWCYEQYGIINGVNFSIPDESPWEIALPDAGNFTVTTDGTGVASDRSVKELPMIVNVTGFTFTPIHDFVPRKQNNDYSGRNLTRYGRQRYIALENDTKENNYTGGPQPDGNGNLNYLQEAANRTNNN